MSFYTSNLRDETKTIWRPDHEKNILDSFSGILKKASVEILKKAKIKNYSKNNGNTEVAPLVRVLKSFQFNVF